MSIRAREFISLRENNNNHFLQANNSYTNDKHIAHKLGIDRTDQRLIGLLLKGATNKNIALHENLPLSTIQRRIRRIYENGYVIKKNELNYKKLGLRKAYLLISLKGNSSAQVAQEISTIKGVAFISLVTGNIDILCTCIFKDTVDIFTKVESIKTIKEVDNVIWSEEVSSTSIQEMSVLGLEERREDSLQNIGISAADKEIIH